MANIKRKWDLISEEYRQKSIKEIIDFFYNEIEMDEEIGIIAAGNILNHFLSTVGIHLYNKGVDDSVLFLRERVEDLESDMEALLKK